MTAVEFWERLFVTLYQILCDHHHVGIVHYILPDRFNAVI